MGQATLASANGGKRPRQLEYDRKHICDPRANCMVDDDLYQQRILEHYENPRHCGNCPHATHRFEDDNPLCGDHIAIELEISPDGRVCDACFHGDGCCVSQAAASMLLEHLHGKPVEEAARFAATDMLTLFGPRLTPTRQRCCLLAWRVFKTALASPSGVATDRGQSCS